MGRSGQQGFVGNVGLRRCTCCGCLVLPFICSGCKVELHKGLSENVKWRKGWQKRTDHAGRDGGVMER